MSMASRMAKLQNRLLGAIEDCARGSISVEQAETIASLAQQTNNAALMEYRATRTEITQVASNGILSAMAAE